MGALALRVSSDGRGLRRLSAILTIVSLAFVASSLIFLAIEIARGWLPLGEPGTAQIVIVVAIFALSFTVLGWVIVRRLPSNLLGWVYLAIGFWQALNMFASDYSSLAFWAASGDLPFASELSWVAVWAWVPGFTLFSTVGILCFPTGGLPSRRWWPVLAVGCVAFALLLVPDAVATWPYRGLQLEQAAALNVPPPADSAVTMAFGIAAVGQLVLLAAMIGSVAGLAARFRQATGVERQQLKWFTFGAVLDFVIIVVWTANILDALTGALSAFVFAPVLPIAIGIAMLRYRLYDIDTIINRSLVYGLLTAVLAGLYAACVALMQRLFQALTGESSDAAIVLTTLLVVTAFTPAKNALQQLVDRRFKDPRDPGVRLAAFIKSLSDRLWSVDPDAAAERLLNTVVDGYGAKGGRIELVGGRHAVKHATGDAITDPALTVTISGNANQEARIELGPRRKGDYTPGDRNSVQNALGALSAAVASRE